MIALIDRLSEFGDVKSPVPAIKRPRGSPGNRSEDRAAAKARKACSQLSQQELKELEEQALATIYGRYKSRKADDDLRGSGSTRAP